MKKSVYRITFIAMMAALTYVVTIFRIPLGASKIHLANAVCLLCGMLLGPVSGGLAAGLGSALYDWLAGGYDFVNVLITFFSKFAMAWVCGLLVHRVRTGNVTRSYLMLTLSAAAGALTYVALYMLKTAVFQLYVYNYPAEQAWITMLAKLWPSLLNAAAAVIFAPLFYHAVVPALKAAGVMNILEDGI